MPLLSEGAETLKLQKLGIGGLDVTNDYQNMATNCKASGSC